MLAVFPMQRGPGVGFLGADHTVYLSLVNRLSPTPVRQDATCHSAEIGQDLRESLSGPRIRRSGWTRLTLQRNGYRHCSAAVRAGGLIPLRFAHFGNWFESFAAPDWQDLSRSPPRRATRIDPAPHSEIAERHGRHVHDRNAPAKPSNRRSRSTKKSMTASWKEPEPYPLFNAAFMRATASSDGSPASRHSLTLAEKPLAAQFWVVRDVIAQLF